MTITTVEIQTMTRRAPGAIQQKRKRDGIIAQIRKPHVMSVTLKIGIFGFKNFAASSEPTDFLNLLRCESYEVCHDPDKLSEGTVNCYEETTTEPNPRESSTDDHNK